MVADATLERGHQPRHRLAEPAAVRQQRRRPTPPPQPPSNRLEAENATISQGQVDSNHAGFSGTGFVNYDNVAGSFVEWTVNADPAGSRR